MQYDHAVKYKGVYYSAGAEVPVEEVEQVKEETPLKEEPPTKEEVPAKEEKEPDKKGK